MRYRFSSHALSEMKRRNIPPEMVESVLANPGQVVPEQHGRNVYQSQVDFGTDKPFLLRVVVADNAEPSVVVTVYRTSKISKYWRSE
ncbi:MAG: DUF4258 domain-containing protein [Armatimonadota bacterium]